MGQVRLPGCLVLKDLLGRNDEEPDDKNVPLAALITESFNEGCRVRRINCPNCIAFMRKTRISKLLDKLRHLDGCCLLSVALLIERETVFEVENVIWP